MILPIMIRFKFCQKKVELPRPINSCAIRVRLTFCTYFEKFCRKLAGKGREMGDKTAEAGFSVSIWLQVLDIASH
jgi:hypothetical protein